MWIIQEVSHSFIYEFKDLLIYEGNLYVSGASWSSMQQLINN